MTWLPLAGLGIGVIWLAVAIVLEQQSKRRLAQLAPRAADVGPAVMVLYQQYLAGRLNPELLEALRLCAREVAPRTACLAVAIDVAAGRYAEALLWRERCADWLSEEEDEHELELVLRLNEAEAMANLGRAEEALKWINPAPRTGYLIAATAAHRTWCLAVLKRSKEAREALVGSAEDLGPYGSEWHLAAAAAAVAGQRWLEADHALQAASLTAVRASTKRNVEFGRALARAAQGQHEQALIHFEAGAAAPYVGQGGEALLSWGDSLAALGRGPEARRAWTLCVERDPQSPAAATARTRVS